MHQTAAASLFGLAYGDAMGRPVEFRGDDEIVAVFGRRGRDGSDVRAATGEGWVAEEALATALASRIEYHDQLAELAAAWD